MLLDCVLMKWFELLPVCSVIGWLVVLLLTAMDIGPLNKSQFNVNAEWMDLYGSEQEAAVKCS